MFGSLKNMFGGKDETPKIEYWLGNIGLTLMVYNNDLETHIQTDIRRYDYFFNLSSELRNSMSAADFENRLNSVIQDIYYHQRLAFQQAEPNDINYIAVVETNFRQLNLTEITDKIWLSATPPHWETSHCITVSAEDYSKENPNNF